MIYKLAFINPDVLPYDVCRAMVVCAATDKDARCIAQQSTDEACRRSEESSAYDIDSPWLDEAITKCETLDHCGPPTCLLRDVLWG